MANLADFYEHEYRGGDSIPNYAQYFIDWKENSAAARQQLKCHLNLRYGSGEKETLDLFVAAKSTRLVIFIHGGYWYSMDKDDYSCVAPEFIKAGISVAVLNYALCPLVTIPTIVSQCRQAIAWLYWHARDYGVSAEQLIITGHSAGGHLAAMMFATDWQAYRVRPNAIVGGVTLSGLFLLDPFLLLGLNAELKLDPESVKALSPAYLAPQISTPLIAAVGSLESNEFKRQSQLIRDAWPVNCVATMILADCHHFNILDKFTDLNSAIWQIGKGMLY
jgi:arylformamidase